ncbi:MAG TPA: DUF5818 domain-containing protein [Candidatus Acidoferrales bacterium]|nr:DUF5818 domain-containing protein [Candidatus Acidoferrales bacterium]
MRRMAIVLGAFLLAAGIIAVAAPAPRQAAKSRDFVGEIWDSACAKAGSHDSMAKQAGIAPGPDMAKKCTLECVSMGSSLVLYNPATKRTYKLDDQAKAKDLAGEKVKVTGAYDVKTHTIHVESIAAR